MTYHRLIAYGPSGPEAEVRDLGKNEGRRLMILLADRGVDSTLSRPEPTIPPGWRILFSTLPSRSTTDDRRA